LFFILFYLIVCDIDSDMTPLTLDIKNNIESKVPFYQSSVVSNIAELSGSQKFEIKSKETYL